MHDVHYKKLAIEPIEIMKANFTKEEYIGYCKGNILKYLLRNKDNPIKEIDKLITYAGFLKDVLKYDFDEC